MSFAFERHSATMRLVGRSLRALAVAAGLAAMAWQPAAAVDMTGSFTATKACPALQSIRKQTNPGDVAIVAGQSYEVLAGNKAVPTHYRITVTGATPPERWVSADCGTYKETVADAAASAALPAGGGPVTAAVLAVSWEPAFCAGHSAKPECGKETADGFDASHFSLHGLWPQPQTREYCGVSKQLVNADKKTDWTTLPEVTLSDATRARLDKEMPGTGSGLERHEWLKHGTCYGGIDRDAYFSKALALLDEVNASAVQALFTAKAGQSITSAEIRAAFDSAFGAGTGDRVKVSCVTVGSRRLVAELTVGLAGPDGDLATMAKAAGTTGVGCPGGIIEVAGKP